MDPANTHHELPQCIPKSPVRHLAINDYTAPLFQVFRPPYLGINPQNRSCHDAFDIIEYEFKRGILINATEIRKFDELNGLKHETLVQAS